MTIAKLQPVAEAYRYERKFLVEGVTLREVQQACLFHPAGFKPIFNPRTINNIYFDTPGFQHYYDNVEGDKHRLKVRIRWYGDMFGYIAKPVLEFKIKNGLLGLKDSYKLNAFTLDHSFSKESIGQALDKKKIPAHIRDEVLGLQPALLNQYYRHYYLSLDKKFRLTIDSNLNYRRISYHTPRFLEKYFDREHIILEMKYGFHDDQEARFVSSQFPFLLTKSSKYVQGLEQLLH
ncbi:polyphosphate polymerase domain-containing protein [Rufibacter immobilis]|uniref:polyphosphate polymerase domain-containing protein n=1 Tax=Rufibacter immobilis TaxID=1348778 RepID=UPI0035EAB3A1